MYRLFQVSQDRKEGERTTDRYGVDLKMTAHGEYLIAEKCCYF